MAGEGFEEFLSVFAEELMRVNLLGTEARSREELLGDAKRSFFVSALVSGLVQGAAKLGSLGVDADPAELGRLYADETAAGFYGADVELYGPETDVYEYEGADRFGTDTDVRSTDTGLRDAYTEPLGADVLTQETTTEEPKLAAVYTPSNSQYNQIDDNKPYKRGRPSFRKRVHENTWDEAVRASPDGVVRDPNDGTPIAWTKGTPRKGIWDMGHKPEQKYSDYHKKYITGEMTKEEFVDWYNDYRNYRPELPSNNRSHKYE